MGRPQKPTSDPIALKFRQLRKEKKMSQAAMAKFVECDKADWSRYENGTRPGGDQIVKICSEQKCNASPTWLLFDRGPMRLTDLAPAKLINGLRDKDPRPVPAKGKVDLER